MNEIHTEDEQVEALKKWWKENGTSVIVAIAVALSSVAGYKYWQGQKMQRAWKASNEYMHVSDQLQKTELEEGDIKRAEALLKDHEGTVYADFTALQLAKVSVEKGDYDAALVQLNNALAAAQSKQLKPIINYRIAQVQFAKGEHDKAITTLTAIKDKGHEALVLELQADIYSAKGDAEKALSLYKQAMGVLGEDANKSKTLQLKYKNVGGKES